MSNLILGKMICMYAHVQVYQPTGKHLEGFITEPFPRTGVLLYSLFYCLDLYTEAV